MSYGAARAPVPIRRRDEARPAARRAGRDGLAKPDRAARLVRALRRRRRGALRARPRPARTPPHQAGADAAGCRRAGRLNDRRCGAHDGGRRGRGRSGPPSDGAARGLRRLRPVAAVAAPRAAINESAGTALKGNRH